MVKKWMYVSVVFVLLFCCIYQKNHSGEIEYSCAAAGEDAQIAAELYEGIEFSQTLTRPVDEMTAIRINFPTFQRTDLEGTICIDVWNNSRHVADKEIDAAEILDGDEIRVDFAERGGAAGDELKIEISASSSPKKCAGLWKYSVNRNEGLNPMISVNGKSFSGITNMSIIYKDCKLSFVWAGLAAYLLILFLISNRYLAAVDWCRRNHAAGYALLFVAAAGILCLRGGVFSYSAIYAEDGLYLSNIMNSGFWKSCISTRLGGSGDFFNMGSYMLLELSLLLNQAVYGYSLEDLPVLIGIVSSIFWASIAVLGYVIYQRKNAFAAFAIYFLIVCIPVGNSTMEIFGRILNEVFIFPVLAVLLLSYSWNMRYEVSKLTVCCDILVLLCGMSFPISFGALGIWVFLGVCCAVKEGKTVLFVKSNGLKMAVLFIGMILLPVMIGSQGASAGLEVKREAFIEFIFGRHMLYAFTYFFYHHLNDILVLFLFGVSVFIILAAIRCEYEKKKCEYAVLVCMGMGCILASSYMRLPMSSFFDGYQYTYPDRYYYGCNILYCIIVIHGLYVLIGRSKDSVKMLRVILSLFMLSLMLNHNLFPKIDRDSLLIRGEDRGIESWRGCLEASLLEGNVDREGRYTVAIYPFRENGNLYMRLPAEYLWGSLR